MKIRTYSELRLLPTHQERFEYLKLVGAPGVATFGFDRWLNQTFYKSDEWKRIRQQVIIRDNGCDLGVEGYPIGWKAIVHHMNPISVDQIVHHDIDILNPEYLILCSQDTHNFIHFGREKIRHVEFADRKPNDQIPWLQ